MVNQDQSFKRIEHEGDPHAFFAVFLATLAGFNVLGVPFLVNMPPGLAVIVPATIAAEIALVATWGVLSPHPFWKRTLLCVVMGSILFGSFALSILAVARGDPDAAGAIGFAALLAPSVYLCIQIPVWILTIWYRCECTIQYSPASLAKPNSTPTVDEGEHPDDPDTNENVSGFVGSVVEPNRASIKTGFSIVDLGVGTAMFAIACAFARFAPTMINGEDEGELLTGLAVACSILPFFSAIVVLIPVRIVLGLTHRASVYSALSIWFGICVIVLLAPLGLTTGSPTIAFILFVLCAAYAVTLCAGLLLARKIGYQLLPHSQTKNQTEPPKQLKIESANPENAS